VRRGISLSVFGLGLAALAFVARGLPFLGFVPIWDGWAYGQCVVDAVASRALFDLDCFGHTSISYTGLLALPQLFALGTYPGFLLVNLVLGVVAIWGFSRLLPCVFPNAPCEELLALTGVFSVYPVFLACAINPTADYGVFVYYVLCLFALLARKDVLAIILGFALAFSKETGIFLYAIAVVWRELIFVRLSPTPLHARWRELLRQAAFLSTPILVYVAVYLVLLVRGATWGGGGFANSDPRGGLIGTFLFKGGQLGSLLGGASPGDVLSGEALEGYFVSQFVAQFAWTLTIFPIAWLARAGAARLLRKPEWRARGRNPQLVLLIGAFAWSAAATRWTPLSLDDRYLLPFLPLLCIVAYGAMASLVRAQNLRRGILAAWLVLFLASNFATLDPVSKLIYGTFRFGDHEMLARTSLTGECCGLGVDQLVYNLEFTAFHYVEDDIFAAIEPTAGTVLLADPQAFWQLVTPLDLSTFRRTLSPRGVEAATGASVYAPPSIAANQRMYLIAYPNFVLEPGLLDRYEVLHVRRFQRLGYEIGVFQVRPKSPAGE